MCLYCITFHAKELCLHTGLSISFCLRYVLSLKTKTSFCYVCVSPRTKIPPGLVELTVCMYMTTRINFSPTKQKKSYHRINFIVFTPKLLI